MAKCKAPLFSARAQGKFANIIVYQERPVGSVAYADNQTNHGNSTTQQYNRSVMTNIRTSWAKLTAEQRTTWNSVARVSGKLSGYHMFVGYYMANVHRPFDIPVTLSN